MAAPPAAAAAPQQRPQSALSHEEGLPHLPHLPHLQRRQQGTAVSLAARARREARLRARAWAVTVLTGVCCAAMAYVINLGVEGIEKLRFVATLPLIRPGGSLLLPWLAFNAVSCAAAGLAGLGVSYVSPLAAGSGIPHIRAFCNGIDVPHLLGLKTLAVKALGAMCSIGSGLVAGKEGPFIQCGACIAWLLLQATNRVFGSGDGDPHEHTRPEAPRTTTSTSTSNRGSGGKPSSGMTPCQGSLLPLHQQPGAPSAAAAAASEGCPQAPCEQPLQDALALLPPPPTLPAAVGSRGGGAPLQSAVSGSGGSKDPAAAAATAAAAAAAAVAADAVPAKAPQEAWLQQQHQQQDQQQQQEQQQQQWWAAWRAREHAWLWARRQQDAAAVGAGAGVAAAFIAPMAGAAYAVEDAATHRNLTMLAQAFFTGGVMVLFLWMATTLTTFGRGALSWVAFTSPLALAFQGTSGTDVRFWWYVWELPLALLLGLLGGGLAGLWTWANTRLLLARKAWLRRRWMAAADVVLVCLLTNTIRLVAAHQSPCLPAPRPEDLRALEQEVTSWRFFDAPTGLYPQLWCPPGQYSEYGQLFMMPVEVAVRSLFSLQPTGNLTLALTGHAAAAAAARSGGGGRDGRGGAGNATAPLALQVSAGTAAGADLAAPADEGQAPHSAAFVFRVAPLAAFMAFVWGMLLLSYGIAAPTGIFIPSLAAGAAGGRLAGQLLRYVTRVAGVDVPICLPGWSVLGATAMLVGTTRLTLANCLIVLESSGAVPMTVPMVLLTIPAKLMADLLFTGIYDWQMADAGYPFVEGVDVLRSRERAAITHHHVKDILDLAAPAVPTSHRPAGDPASLGAGAAGSGAGQAVAGSDAPAGPQHVLHVGGEEAAEAGDPFHLPLPPTAAPLHAAHTGPQAAAAPAAAAAAAAAATAAAAAAAASGATAAPAAGPDEHDEAAAAGAGLGSSQQLRPQHSRGARRQHAAAAAVAAAAVAHAQPCAQWQQLQERSLGVLVTPEASLATATLIMRRLCLWELPVVSVVQVGARLAATATTALPACAVAGCGAAGSSSSSSKGGTPPGVSGLQLLSLLPASTVAAAEGGGQAGGTALASSSRGSRETDDASSSSYSSVDSFGTGYFSCSSQLSRVGSSSASGNGSNQPAGQEAAAGNGADGVPCGRHSSSGGSSAAGAGLLRRRPAGGGAERRRGVAGSGGLSRDAAAGGRSNVTVALCGILRRQDMAPEAVVETLAERSGGACKQE